MLQWKPNMLQNKTISWPFYLTAVLLLGAIGSGVYLYLELTERTDERDRLLATTATLTTNLDKTTKDLNAASNTVAALVEELDITEEELDDVERDYEREKDKNEDLEDEYRDTIETVKVLDKLSQIDEELLQKYSRVSFLNENYIPSGLEDIRDRYILESRSDQSFHADAIDFLEDLIKDAERDDIDLKVVSAYRSFETQAQLKGQFLVTYGEGANTFSADQGFSEHQLGTAVDFTDTEANALRESFANTEAYEWLLDNAYKHGFILSYPEGNQFYVFEPWHWRFVGEDLARDLNRADAGFYDWEQRKIDEYLISLFD